MMNYQDAMAICRVYGPPDLFVTFTCNTKWREIADALRFEPGQQPCDRSDVVVRVFHMKVDEFMAGIREGRTFCPVCVGKTYSELLSVVFVAGEPYALPFLCSPIYR